MIFLKEYLPRITTYSLQFFSHVLLLLSFNKRYVQSALMETNLLQKLSACRVMKDILQSIDLFLNTVY